jgi:Outer membrane protein beta-barrel domain
MTKKILAVIALVFCSAISYGQIKLHIGANTAGHASFVLDKGLNEDPRYNSQMTYTFSPIGLTFGADFKSGFSLQLESILSKYGQVYEVINVAKQVVGERKIDLTYINLPLLLRFVGNPDAKARFNFMLGPQLSLLTAGQETLNYTAGTFQIPSGVTQIPTTQFPAGQDLSTIQGAVQNADGTWTLPAQPTIVIAQKGDIDPLKRFRNADLQIAAGMGLDIRINQKFYISSLIRANYGIVDARGQDLIDKIQNGTAKDLFGQRSNLQVGIQIGGHYFLNVGK